MSKSVQENLLFKITVEQTGATPAQLDSLSKSLTALKTAASGLMGGDTKGFSQSLRDMGTNADTLNKSITALNTNLSKVGSGPASASIKKLDSDLKQASTSLISGGRAADSFSASMQKVQHSGGPVANMFRKIGTDINIYRNALSTATQANTGFVASTETLGRGLITGGRAADSFGASMQKMKGPLDSINSSLKLNVDSLNLQSSAAKFAQQSNNTLAASMERIKGINVQMAASNKQAADSLSLQGRQADSAAASLQRLGQTAQQSAAGMNAMGMANRNASATQQTATGLDEQRTQAIMHQARQVSGLAMGFGVLTMSMDSVIGIGGMLEMQQEKVALMEERLAKAVKEHGEGSHQATQASAAYQKALRGEEYIAREATFAYHNMLFMLTSIGIMMFNDLLPSLIKVTGKMKEMTSATTGALGPLKAFAAELGMIGTQIGGVFTRGTDQSKKALQGLSTISKTEAKTIESAMTALGAQAAAVLGSSIPMSLDTARRAQTNFTFESEAQQKKFSQILGEYENVAKLSMAGAAAEIGSAATTIGQHHKKIDDDTRNTTRNIGTSWKTGADGVKQFDTDSRSPLDNYINKAGQADMDTRTVTKNLASSWQGAAVGMGGVSQVVESLTDVFDSNGKKVVENAGKVGGLRAAIAGLSLVSKTGIGALIAAGAAIVLYGTNAFGARDAINGLGVEMGKIHPIAKAAGEALVGLAGVFGLTGESAKDTVKHFQTASHTITTAWNDMVADMQRSNDKMTRDMGNAIVKVNNEFTKMGEHLGGQLEATGRTWDQFWEQIKNKDYKGAVTTIEQAFAALPGIFAQIGTDLNGLFSEIDAGLMQFGENFRTGFFEAIDVAARDATTRFNTFVSESQAELEAIVGIGGEIIGRFFETIQSQIDASADMIGTWIDENIVTPFNEWTGKVTTRVSDVWEYISEGGLLADITTWVDTEIVAPFNDIVTKITTKAADIWAYIIEGGLATDVGTWIDTEIITPIHELPTKIVGMGKEIVEGILSGDYAAAIQEWASGVWADLNTAWHNFITGGKSDANAATTQDQNRPLSDMEKSNNLFKNQSTMRSLINNGEAKSFSEAESILRGDKRWKAQNDEELAAGYSRINAQGGTFGGQYQFATHDGSQSSHLNPNDPNWGKSTQPNRNQTPQDIGTQWNDIFTKLTGGGDPAQQLTKSTDKPAVGPQWWQTHNGPDVTKPGGPPTGLGEWGKKLTLGAPPLTRTKPALDIEGNQLYEDDGKTPATETDVTQFGKVKAAVDANKEAIADYNRMLQTSNGVTEDASGIAALYALGMTEQILRQKEMEAAVHTNAAAIRTWEGQLKTAGYQQTLLNTGFNDGQMAMLGWAEEVRMTEGSLNAYDQALRKQGIHNVAHKDGVNQQRDAFQQLQLGLDTTRGKYETLGQQITSQGAVNVSYKKGIEEQKLALLEQVMALGETTGKHQQLSNQFATGLPQAVAYGEGLMGQVDAYQQQALGIESSMGKLMVMNTAMEMGVAHGLNFKQGLVDTAVALYEESEAVSQSEGAIKMWSAGIKSGMVGDTAFREGVVQTKMQLIEQYKELQRSGGALETFGHQLKYNVPQALAYAQAVADAKMANAQLRVEMAGLVGTVEMAYKSFAKSEIEVRKQNIAFLEGKLAVVEWGWELKTAEKHNAGMISGLREIGTEVGVKLPKWFKGGAEDVKRFISQMSGLGPIAQEVIANFDQMGDSIAKSLGEALKEGNKAFDDAIEEIEEKLGFDLPESAIAALEGSGLGQNMLSTFQQFAAIGMKAFSNMPMDDVKEMSHDLLGEFENMYNEMDSGMQTKLAPVMKQFRDIVAKGPEKGEMGLVNYILELNATAEQIPASTSAGKQALTEISELKFDALAQGWTDLINGFEDQEGMTSAQTKMLELAGIDLDGGKKAQWEGILTAFANDKPLTQAQQALVNTTEAATGLSISADGIKPAAEGANTAIGGLAGGLGQSMTALVQSNAAAAGYVATLGTLASVTQSVTQNMADLFIQALDRVTAYLPTFGTTLTTSITSHISLLGPIFLQIPTSFQIALDQINTVNIPTFFTNMASAFTTGIATATVPVSTMYVAFDTQFTLILTNLVTFFATFSSSVQSNIDAMGTVVQGLAVIFNDTFRTIEGNTAGYLTSIAGHHETMATNAETAVSNIAVVFNDTYRTAEGNTQGYLNSIQKANEDMVAAVEKAVAKVAVAYNTEFKRAANDAWGYIKQLGQLTIQAMNDIVEAAAGAADGITSIGDAASEATGEVSSLISELEAIPEEITVRIKIQADPVPKIKGAASGMANGLFMADGGSVQSGIYGTSKHERNRVVVGESGDETIIRTGLRSGTTTVEHARHQQYVANLGRREPELLTVIPLEGTNAMQFKNKHPEFFASGVYNAGSAQMDAYRAAMQYAPSRTPMSPEISKMLYGRIRYDKRGNAYIDGRLVFRSGPAADYDAFEGIHRSHGSHGNPRDRSHFRMINGSNEDIRHNGTPFTFGSGNDYDFDKGKLVIGRAGDYRSRVPAGGAGSGNEDMPPMTTDRIMQTQRVYSDYISDRVARARDQVRSQQQDSVYGEVNHDIPSSLEERADFSKFLMPEETAETPGRRRVRGEHTMGPKRNFEEDYTIFMKQLIDKIAGKIDGKIRINIHSQVDERIWGKMTNSKLMNDFSRS